MRLKFWVSDSKSQKLQNQSWNTLMSNFLITEEVAQDFFSLIKNKLQDSFDNSNRNMKLSCLDALIFYFLRMTSWRKPSFAVAPGHCSVLQKHQKIFSGEASPNFWCFTALQLAIAGISNTFLKNEKKKEKYQINPLLFKPSSRRNWCSTHKSLPGCPWSPRAHTPAAAVTFKLGPQNATFQSYKQKTLFFYFKPKLAFQKK